MTQAPSRTTVVNGVDLDAVAAAVRACPGVDDLDGGPLSARLATYLPGRKIDGLKLTDDTLTVQIRIVWDVPVTEVGEQIRAATLLLAPGRFIDLVIADITPAPGYEVIPEPDPEPAVSEALTPLAPIAPAPAGTPAAEDALVSVPPPAPAEPVVVERTVSLTEKVVLDRTSVDASAARTSPSQAPPTAPGMSSVPADPVTRSESDSVAGDQAESDSVVWTTETTTTPPSAADGDESSSAPTTPTPAEIPPRS